MDEDMIHLKNSGKKKKSGLKKKSMTFVAEGVDHGRVEKPINRLKHFILSQRIMN